MMNLCRKISRIVFILIFLIIGLILASNMACRDVTPPDSPFNLEYKINKNLAEIVITWYPALNATEEIYFLVNFDDEYWNYVGPNTFFQTHFDRRVGNHIIKVKAIDKTGNESVPALLQFEYTD